MPFRELSNSSVVTERLAKSDNAISPLQRHAPAYQGSLAHLHTSPLLAGQFLQCIPYTSATFEHPDSEVTLHVYLSLGIYLSNPQVAGTAEPAQEETIRRPICAVWINVRDLEPVLPNLKAPQTRYELRPLIHTAPLNLEPILKDPELSEYLKQKVDDFLEGLQSSNPKRMRLIHWSPKADVAEFDPEASLTSFEFPNESASRFIYSESRTVSVSLHTISAQDTATNEEPQYSTDGGTESVVGTRPESGTTGV